MWTEELTLQSQNNWDFLNLSCFSTRFLPPPNGFLPQLGKCIEKSWVGSCCNMIFFSPLDHMADCLIGNFDFLEQCWLLITHINFLWMEFSVQLTWLDPEKMIERLPHTIGKGRGLWPCEVHSGHVSNVLWDQSVCPQWVKGA